MHCGVNNVMAVNLDQRGKERKFFLKIFKSNFFNFFFDFFSVMDSVVVSKSINGPKKKDKNSKKKYPLSGAGALSMDVGEHLGNRESQMTNKPLGINN